MPRTASLRLRLSAVSSALPLFFATVSGVLLVVMTAGSARAQSFAPPNTLSAGTGAQKAVAADLNGDGVPDLASANHGNSGSPSVSVFIGVGDGTFAARRDYPAAQGAG